MADYTMLPEHMQDAARKYVENGVLTGGFLQSVLENNLVAAFTNADDINTERMFDWASWLYNEVPYAAWGNIAKVNKWCAQGGEKGIMEKAQEKKSAGD